MGILRNAVCLPTTPGFLDMRPLVQKNSLLDLLRRDTNSFLQKRFEEDNVHTGETNQNNWHNRHERRNLPDAQTMVFINQGAGNNTNSPLYKCCTEVCSIADVCAGCYSDLALDECRRRATWRLPQDYFISTKMRSYLFMMKDARFMTMPATIVSD